MIQIYSAALLKENRKRQDICAEVEPIKVGVLDFFLSRAEWMKKV